MLRTRLSPKPLARLLLTGGALSLAAWLPAQKDARLLAIAGAPAAERIESDIRTLAGFGTRHTMSDTVSATRGIGAARRWIEAEFRRISAACGGCLEVHVQRELVLPHSASSGQAPGNLRIDTPTVIVNVYAVLRGTARPNDYVLMSGDIDSRVSDVMNRTSDSPGANDNASGMAGVLEAARVLSQYRFPGSIVLAGLSGEEQGLFGGRALAEKALLDGWNLVAVLNNDMIGNITGVDGVTDNREFRIFSEPNFPKPDERVQLLRRFYGGEVDGPSRQLARYIEATTRAYLPELRPMMIYRLDRFGRGGHHRPFNDAGFAGVRIMEAHEHYDRQHQDLRVEDGRTYGDVISGVDFGYAAKLTAVNATVLARLAMAPPAPETVEIGGAVEPAARLKWAPSAGAVGYKVYYRLTTEPQWSDYFWVPGGDVTSYRATGFVVDNYYFGVAAVGSDGVESLVAFPEIISR